MKAIVKTAPGEGRLELLEWPEPSPAENEVKFRVGAAGICGTDIHIVRGTWACRPPVVLGHEWSGTIVEAGPRVKGFKPGDRVVAANPARTCGVCRHCRAGNPFMCPERVSAGYMIDGAFADYVCIDAQRCHHLPDHVSFREAALGEPLAVAVRAVTERTAVHVGDFVLVSGPGCIGMLTLQVAKLEGARVVVAGLEKDAHRLEVARRLGADEVIHAGRQDVVEEVRRLSGGPGADLAFECSGSPASLAACLDAVRKEGTLVQLGMFSGPVEVEMNRVSQKELRLIGCYAYLWTTWQRTVHILAEKKINIDAMISDEFPLDEYEQAFLKAQEGSALKVLLKPGGGAA